MDVVAGLPATGTCDLSTLGRRSGRYRRIEIWYVLVDGAITLTGTPGARDWLANLRADPAAVLHLREPARDVDVVATEVVGDVERRRFLDAVFDAQPWYAAQPFPVATWLASAPMVVLTPVTAPA